MPRIVHFELGAVEPERAAEFYRQVFDWQIKKWDGPQPYWVVTTGPDSEPGINGGIMRHQDGEARTVNTVDVDDLEAYLQKVEQAGGRVEVPRLAIPGVGYQAYCRDSEGNLFGLHQRDSSAK